MRVLIDGNLAELKQSGDEYKSRLESHTFTATPDLADRLGKAAVAYNWVHPAVIAAHVLTGNDAVLDQVAQQIGKQAWRNGATPTNSRPGRISKQEQMAAYQRAIAKANAASVDRRIAPTSRTTPKPAGPAMEFAPYGPVGIPGFEEKKKGSNGTLGMLSPIGAPILDWMDGEFAKNLFGSAYDLTKAGIAGFGAGAMFIPQALTAEAAALANYLPSGNSFKTQRNKSLIEQFITGPLIEETYAGQILNQTAQGFTSEKLTTWNDIMGSGFFPGGRVVSEQQKAAATYRPLLGEKQVPWTFGRAGAQALTDVGVIEEGTVPYNLVSGAIDFAMMIKLDPSLSLKGIKSPFGSAGEAASAVRERDALRVAAGLAEGERPTVVPTLWDEWKGTPRAVKILQPFVDETNPAQVWRNLGRKALLSADEMAQATDHPSLISVFDKAVNTLDPAYNVREVPAGMFNSVSGFGYKIKQSAQRFTNLFEMMPESTFIPLSDPQVAAVRLDDIMGFIGFDLETRNAWINRFITVHKEGTSKAFFDFLSDWEKTALKPALLENGVPEEIVPALTRWKKSTMDQITRFTLQDIADGVPAAWMEAGGLGPLRTTQLLQDGAYIIDPAELKDVAKMLGKVYKIERELEKYPGLGKVSRGIRKTTDVGGSLAGAFMSIWKATVVAMPRYLTRVLPDEQGRVLLNGTFDKIGHYVSAMIDGRWDAKLLKNGGMFTADVFGDPINKAKLVGELEHKIAEYKGVEKEIIKLREIGKTAEADDLLRLYADELNSIDDLVVQKERAEQALDSMIPTLNDALIGRIPGSARKRIMGEVQDGVHTRLGNLTIVSKNVEKEQRFWVDGVAQEIADLHNNPHIRRIANGSLFPDDSFVLNGIRDTAANHAAAGNFASAEEELALWLHNGSGRKYFTKYFTNYANLPEGYQWDTLENAREFVRALDREVQSIAGSNVDMLEAVVSGTFNGEPAFSRNARNLVSINKNFTKYIKDEFLVDASSPRAIRYRGTLTTVDKKSPLKPVSDVWDFILDGFFKGMYGKTSDTLSRSPSFRAAYWGRVEEVAHLATPDAAEELLKNLDAANLPRPQADRIRRLLKMADGGNDLEAVDVSARIFALNYTRDLLFDATKKSAFGAQHVLAFPFFEAYREQASTWMKLAFERPQNIHKIDVALRAFREADGIGLGDSNGDGKKDGFLFRDPQSGEERFAVPGSSALGKIFAGVDFGGFSLPTGSLTLVNQVLPGLGPVAQFPVSYFVPKTKDWQWANDLIFPYGRPEETGAQPAGGLLGLEFPRPTWFKRIAPGLADFAQWSGDKLKVSSVGQMFSDAITKLAGDPQESEVWRSYYLRTLQSLSSTRDIPKTQREIESLLADAEDKTNKLYFLRGLGNFILPGTPVSKFMAKTKLGSVELGVLADEMRRYEQEAQDAGETRSQGAARFIDVYGPTVWAIFGSLRTSKKYEGLNMSKDFEDWFSANTDLINTYPKIASFFGPQAEPGKFGPAEQAVYNRYIAKGFIKTQSGEDLIAQAQTNVAFTYYESVRNSMSSAQQDSSQGKAILNDVKENLKEAFPKWDVALAGAESKSKREQQIKQLREILTEPKVAGNIVADAASAYLKFRDTGVEDLLKQGVKGWANNSKSQRFRQDLLRIGDALAKAYPEFSSLWERVLSREFEQPVGVGQ